MREADEALEYIHTHHVRFARVPEAEFNKIKEDLNSLTESGKTHTSMLDIHKHVKSLNKLIKLQTRLRL